MKRPLDRAEHQHFDASVGAFIDTNSAERAIDQGVKVSFLYDLEVHVLLGSLPLLIAAEVIVHNRMKPILRQFLGRQIVTPAPETRFESIIESAVRLRN